MTPQGGIRGSLAELVKEELLMFPQKASGWHYDLMLALMNLVIICTDGGGYVLWK
jgi:hypothetical protein